MEKKYDDCYVKEQGDTYIIGFNDDEKSMKTINDIVFFEFSKSEGEEVNEGDKLLSVEAMKGTMSLKSRVSGKIISLNKDVEEDPEILKDEPKTWLVKIKA